MHIKILLELIFAQSLPLIHTENLTWQFFETLYDLGASLLHRDSIVAHHEAEHHQRDELTRVRLSSQSHCVSRRTYT